MSFEVARVPMESTSQTGQTDEFAEAVLTDEGLFIEGVFSESTGLTWAELARVLKHPFAKAMLEEAEMEG